MDLVLVLDRSGSMYGQIGAVQSFALSLVDQFVLSAAWTRVGVVEFSSGATKLGGLSYERGGVDASVGSYGPASGWTDISSGLSLGLGLLLGGGRCGATASSS